MSNSGIDKNFVEAILMHENATNEGNSRKANRAFEKIVNSYIDLKKDAKNAVIVLTKLLQHESESVQMWSATYLLPFSAQIAEKKLQEIADGQGFTAFDALMTLKEWKKGTLKLPPFD